jgi:hypothetical protein
VSPLTSAHHERGEYLPGLRADYLILPTDAKGGGRPQTKILSALLPALVCGTKRLRTCSREKRAIASWYKPMAHPSEGKEHLSLNVKEG